MITWRLATRDAFSFNKPSYVTKISSFSNAISPNWIANTFSSHYIIASIIHIHTNVNVFVNDVNLAGVASIPQTFSKISSKSKNNCPSCKAQTCKIHDYRTQIVKDVEEAAKRPRSEGREPAEEIITEPAEYYDGSKDLNKIYVNCHLYEVETDCFHQNTCGWCDSKGKCIMGNKMGPLESCALESYRFH